MNNLNQKITKVHDFNTNLCTPVSILLNFWSNYKTKYSHPYGINLCKNPSLSTAFVASLVGRMHASFLVDPLF